MEAGWYAALSAAIGGILGVLGTHIVRIIQARNKAQVDLTTAQNKAKIDLMTVEKEEQRKSDHTAVSQWRELSDRQQKQIDRQESLISELVAEHTDCQVVVAELYGVIKLLHDKLSSCCAAIRKYGEDIEDPDPLPPKPERPSRHQEFVARQVMQDSKNLAAAKGKIEESTPPRS